MSHFDEEPDGDPHGECAAEIHRLKDDLTRAKNLLVRLWNKHPAARAQIEGSTGSWFIWGVDRDATEPGVPASEQPTTRGPDDQTGSAA